MTFCQSQFVIHTLIGGELLRKVYSGTRAGLAAAYCCVPGSLALSLCVLCSEHAYATIQSLDQDLTLMHKSLMPGNIQTSAWIRGQRTTDLSRVLHFPDPH